MIAFKGGRLSAAGRRTGLGKRFIPLVRYLTEGQRGTTHPHRLTHFAARNLPATSPEAAGYLLACCAEDRRADFELPVYHFGASAAPGEELTPAQWEQVADWMLTELGLTEHESAIFIHDDRGHQHVHVVVNRVPEVGKPFDVWLDHPKMRRAVRHAEQVYGLQVVAEPLGYRAERTRDAELAAEPANQQAQAIPELAHEPARSQLIPGELPAQPALTDAEFHAARRRDREPLADVVRRGALADFLAADSWNDLASRLNRLGLRLEPARRGGGVVVRTDADERVSVSKIDRRLSGPKLAKRFGEPFAAYRKRVPATSLPDAYLPAQRVKRASSDERASAIIRQLGKTQVTFTEQEIRRHVKWQRDQAEVVATVLAHPDVERVALDADGRPLYTTASYRRAEATLLNAAASLDQRSHLALKANAVKFRMRWSFRQLSDEQRAAVLLATAGSDLALIAGRAGSGKTTLAKAIVTCYENAGYRVQGAALAGKAAEGLGQAVGIDSRTLASLRRSWALRQNRLDARTVLLVDEAGMLGSRELGELLTLADAAGAKVILLGDPDQFQAIEAGDAFASLLEYFPHARVDTIRRQRIDWMLRASVHFADGRVDQGLRLYDDHGAVRWSGDPSSATWDLATSYIADCDQHPKASRLVLARRNAEVDELNTLIRLHRRQRGELGAAIRLRDREYAVGDRIVFTKNDHREHHVRTQPLSRPRGVDAIGVKNGTLGTILAASAGDVSVRLDDGRIVRFAPRRFQDIRHGYAVTLHKAQGATVDRAFVLLDPLLDRHGTYVAATRHRDHLELWLDDRSFADLNAAARALGRRGPNGLLASIDGTDGASASDRASYRLRELVVRQAVVTWDELLATPEERAIFEALPELAQLDEHHVTTRDYRAAEEHLGEVTRELSRRWSSRIGTDPPPETGGIDPIVHAVDGPDLTVFEGNSSDAEQHFEAIVDQYAGTDCELITVSFTAHQADALGRRLDVESRTFAGLTRRPERIGERSVLLVDQAHLADTRTLDKLLSMVDKAGGRAVLVGDAQGFDSLGAGDAFRMVREDVGAVALRPENESPSIRVNAVFEELAESDRLHIGDRPRAELARAYLATPIEDRPLVLVHRRQTAKQLNGLIRSRRSHELGRAIELGGRQFAEADRVVFTASDTDGRSVRTVASDGVGVRSGALGTVVAVGKELRVRLDEGRLVAFDPRDFDAIDYGYALTTFRANGQRADHVLVLAERSMDRAAAQVALSSHKQTLTLFASSVTFEGGVKEIAETFARESSKPLARDVGQERRQAPPPEHRTDPRLAPLARDRSRSGRPARAATSAQDRQIIEWQVDEVRQAIRKIDRFDEMVVSIAQLQAELREMPFEGDAQKLYRKTHSYRFESFRFKRWDRIRMDAARLRNALSAQRRSLEPGGRDAVVNELVANLASVRSEDLAKLSTSERILLQELRETTVEPLERAAEAYDRAEQSMVRAHRHIERDPDLGHAVLQFGTKAVLRAAPREVQRVVAAASRVAELYRDTPGAVRRALTPRLVQRVQSAVRLIENMAKPPGLVTEAIERAAAPWIRALRDGRSAHVSIEDAAENVSAALRRRMLPLSPREQRSAVDLANRLTRSHSNPPPASGQSAARLADRLASLLRGRQFDPERILQSVKGNPADVQKTADLLRSMHRALYEDFPRLYVVGKVAEGTRHQSLRVQLRRSTSQIDLARRMAPPGLSNAVGVVLKLSKSRDAAITRQRQSRWQVHERDQGQGHEW